MTARPSTKQRESKPTIDAVNDAVAALSEVVRSLRASAKRAKSSAKAGARDIKAKAKTAGKGAGAKVREVGRRITTGIERAWGVLTDGAVETNAKVRASVRKSARGDRT